MATTDERDGEAVDLARSAPTSRIRADGDDIQVVPADIDEPVGLSRRHALVGGGVALVLVVIVALALFARHSRPTTGIRTSGPASTLPQAVVAARPVPKAAPKSPPIAAASVPSTAAPTTVRAVVPPTATAAATTPTAPAPTTVAPPKQYGASALTWDAPRTLSVGAGRSNTLVVTARNPTDGIVDLPHPLSCTPRLDHREVCPETVQQIASGQSASARYTIDAHGIAPGTYSLSIEGVLTVRVTVS